MLANMAPASVNYLRATFGIYRFPINFGREELNVTCSHGLPFPLLLELVHDIVVDHSLHVIFPVGTNLIRACAVSVQDN